MTGCGERRVAGAEQLAAVELTSPMPGLLRSCAEMQIKQVTINRALFDAVTSPVDSTYDTQSTHCPPALARDLPSLSRKTPPAPAYITWTQRFGGGGQCTFMYTACRLRVTFASPVLKTRAQGEALDSTDIENSGASAEAVHMEIDNQFLDWRLQPWAFRRCCLRWWLCKSSQKSKSQLDPSIIIPIPWFLPSELCVLWSTAPAVRCSTA